MGVGIVYFSGLDEVIAAGEGLIETIEIEPATFWYKTLGEENPYSVDREALHRIAAFRGKKLIHGVGFPVGGTIPPDERHLPPLRQTISALNVPWISEHLSFNRFRDGNSECATGFLLPPLQTAKTMEHAVENIRAFKSKLPVPFAFETGVNYLSPQQGEMSDGAFFAAISEQADCGILLDLHNLWCNERNGRQSILDVIGNLPLERIWEIHLAGGDELDGYWLDSHSGLVPDALMKLAAEVVPHLPNLRAINFELMPEYIAAKKISTEAILDQIRRMRELWSRRIPYGRELRNRTRITKEPESTNSLGSPQAWERTLGQLVVGQPSNDRFPNEIERDRGIHIYRQLVVKVRAGMFVGSLKFTYRYLVLMLGEPSVLELMEEFWRGSPPNLFPGDEAQRLVCYLKDRGLDIPHLNELMDSELATHRSLIDGTSEVVPFSCDPLPFLAALGEGRLPSSVGKGNYELFITGPSKNAAKH